MKPGVTIPSPFESTRVAEGPARRAISCAVADGLHRVPRDGDGAGPRARGVAGPDPAVDHEVGGRGSGRAAAARLVIAAGRSGAQPANETIGSGT